METPEHEWTWDYHECERCGDFATHELWFGAELLHRYCNPCGNDVAIEHANYMHAVLEATAVPADGALSDITYRDVLGYDPGTDDHD